MHQRYTALIRLSGPLYKKRVGVNRRWDTWRSRPGQVPTDALANWTSKTKAEVEWASTLTRLPNNTPVHIVTPILTCVKSHPLTDDRGATLSYPYSDPSQARALAESVVEDWRLRHHEYYELIEYTPHTGGYGSSCRLSIMVCYKLKRCLIQGCEGQGPSLKEAKSAAARKLLESGHCVRALITSGKVLSSHRLKELWELREQRVLPDLSQTSFFEPVGAQDVFLMEAISKPLPKEKRFILRLAQFSTPSPVAHQDQLWDQVGSLIGQNPVTIADRLVTANSDYSRCPDLA
ncbi:hypothetical protein RSAG8_02791, partial [Rhizoctonia solani AG-8 WAC10335]